MSDRPESSDRAEPIPKKGHGCFTWLLILIGITALTFGLLSKCGNDTSNTEDSDQLAKVSCQDHIKKNLKDPSSAEFSDIVLDGPKNHEWTITGTVRARNSFGGMAVSTFTCHARNDEGTYYTSYTLSD